MSKGPGRPRKEFDLEIVAGLGRIGATWRELAAALGCAESTIEDRMRNDPDFRGAYESAFTELKSTLRRAQIRVADEGNPTMLIWLGKQMLGQVDKREQDVQLSGKPDAPPLTVVVEQK